MDGIKDALLDITFVENRLRHGIIRQHITDCDAASEKLPDNTDKEIL